MTEEEIKAMSAENVQNIINELYDSPVYNLTLGSKELVHSDFWAWLMDKYKEFVRVFFDEIDISQIKEIKREFKNCDITIIMKNKDVYIIENKLKSLPNKEQLIRYEDACKKSSNNFIMGVITGLIDPNFNLCNWNFMSYNIIAEKIRAVKKTIINLNDFDSKIIDEYCYVIEKVYAVVIKSLNDFNYNDDYLKKIRLNDICQKLQIAKFADYLKGREEEIKSLAPNYELEIHTDFSNGNALIDIDWKKVRDNGDTETRMGIQIQGNQYRRFIAKYPYDGTIKTLFEEYKGKNWLEDKIVNGNNKTIFGKKTGMIKNYCKYETTEYKMVYQHWDITKNEKCTDYDELFKIIMKDLETAKI